MGESLKKKLGIEVQFDINGDELKIKFEDNKNVCDAKLDEITINLKIVELNNLEIKKNGLKMDFKAPIICDKNNIDTSESIIAGFSFEGRDKEKIMEIVEEIAKTFGPEWENAVRKRKKEILKRNKI